MFIHMHRINLILHCFLEILHFRILQSVWSRAFWPITWEAQYCQIRSLRWIKQNNMIFIFNYIQKKLKTKFFKKYKRHYFCSILPIFGHNSVLKLFSFNSEIVTFWDSDVVPNLKRKLMRGFHAIQVSHACTYALTDGQVWIYRFLPVEPWG